LIDGVDKHQNDNLIDGVDKHQNDILYWYELKKQFQSCQ
jgi:hypothetical protein